MLVMSVENTYMLEQLTLAHERGLSLQAVHGRELAPQAADAALEPSGVVGVDPLRLGLLRLVDLRQGGGGEADALQEGLSLGGKLSQGRVEVLLAHGPALNLRGLD